MSISYHRHPELVNLSIWSSIFRHLSSEQTQHATLTLASCARLSKRLQIVAESALYRTVTIGPNHAQLLAFKDAIALSARRATTVRTLRLRGAEWLDASLLCEIMWRLVRLADLSWNQPRIGALVCLPPSVRTFRTSLAGLGCLLDLSETVAYLEVGAERSLREQERRDAEEAAAAEEIPSDVDELEDDDGDPEEYEFQRRIAEWRAAARIDPERDVPGTLAQKLAGIKVLVLDGDGPTIRYRTLFREVPELANAQDSRQITHLHLYHPPHPVQTAVEGLSKLFGRTLLSFKLTLHPMFYSDRHLFPTRFLTGTAFPKLRHLEVDESELSVGEVPASAVPTLGFLEHNYASCPELRVFVWRWTAAQFAQPQPGASTRALPLSLMRFDANVFEAWPELVRMERSTLGSGGYRAFERHRTFLGRPCTYDEDLWLRT